LQLSFFFSARPPAKSEVLMIFACGRGQGAVCLSADRFGRLSRGAGWNFKNSGFALRQFEIPDATAPGKSFGQTAPMQPDKPPQPPATWPAHWKYAAAVVC
jgi:hypothetical protein